jgi:DNA-binding NarL/FixJ family response regulator
LTSREIDVLRLMAKGMDNTQIASALTVSEHTVKFHVGNIYTKLGMRSRGEAIVAAFKCGLVKT